MQSSDSVLVKSFARFDKVALGVACGSVLGLIVLLATLILVIKGGGVVGPNLALLGQFFPGYTVTASGGLVGLGYGFTTGFVLGFAFAALHNVVSMSYLLLVQFRANITGITHYIDPDRS